MSVEYKKIGLSLGADLCWPAAFEALLERLDLNIERKGKEIRFECERVRVEPFDLQYKPKYNLVVDRVNHWYNISREWIKKISLILGYLYNFHLSKISLK